MISEKEFLTYLQNMRAHFYNTGNAEAYNKVQNDINNLINNK